MEIAHEAIVIRVEGIQVLGRASILRFNSAAFLLEAYLNSRKEAEAWIQEVGN
jgi:hypothetical protein